MHNPTKPVGFFVALGAKTTQKTTQKFLPQKTNFIILLLFLDFYGLCGILAV